MDKSQDEDPLIVEAALGEKVAEVCQWALCSFNVNLCPKSSNVHEEVSQGASSPASVLHVDTSSLVQDSVSNGEEDSAAMTLQSPSKPVEESSGKNRDSSGLLSPVDLKLAAPRSVPLESLDSLCRREDSIDSGYADNWTGPSPLPISPPRSERRFSTLSILSSPFGTPSHRVLSPTYAPATSSGWPAATLFSAKSNVADDAEAAGRHSDVSTLDDLDSPSEYHRRHSTSSRGSLNPVPDVEDTVRPPAPTTLHDEGFHEGEGVSAVEEHSTHVPDDDDTRHVDQVLEDYPTFSSPPADELPTSYVQHPDVFDSSQESGDTSEVMRRLSSPPHVDVEDVSYVEETPSKRSSHPLVPCQQ